MVLPDLLTGEEMQAALHVTERTLELWRYRRKIRYYRPNGGRVLYPATEVARLLKESEQPVVWEGNR